MNTEERLPAPNGVSPFERIRRTSADGAEYRSSREFVQVLGYSDYRNCERAMRRVKTACFNSGQRIEGHFVEITEMILGKATREGIDGYKPLSIEQDERRD
jgi:DNA-damage-inducible protein D